MVFFHLEGAGSTPPLSEVLVEAMVILDVMACSVYSSTPAGKQSHKKKFQEDTAH